MVLRYGELALETTTPAPGASAPSDPSAAGATLPSDSGAFAAQHEPATPPMTTVVPAPGAGRNVLLESAPPRASLPVISLHGVELHAIDEAAAIGHILAELEAGRGGIVVTPNLDHLRRCGDDVSFSALVGEADLVLADGMPLVWASRLQGTPLPGRVAGSDLIWSLSRAAAERGRSIYMLGGAPGTAESAAAKLRERYPGLKIAGTHCPPVGFENDDTQIGLIITQLEALQPDIVYVALGSPKQEKLIERIRRTLPGGWWIGVGISFSFVSGEVRRAPKWMQRWGLEWLHRLLQEPRRLFRRYILVGLPFAISLLSGAALKGLGRRFKTIDPRTLRRRSVRAPKLAFNGSNGNGNGNGWHGGNGHTNASLATLEPEAAPSIAQTLIRAPEAAPTVVVRGDGGAAGKALNRLVSLVLLGGSVRQTELVQRTGRSTLDLPVDEGGSILNHWLAHAAELAQYATLETLPVTVLVSRNSPEPVTAAARYEGSYLVTPDKSEFRGTGGVLRDLAQYGQYDDEDLVLVANAAQLLLDPLSVVAAALDHKHGDVTVIGHHDGTPSGVMLVRCKALRLIPPTGFVDMKEQALPTIASQFNVKVLHVRKPTALPIRTLGDYIAALKHYHRRRIGKPATNDPLAEDWQPAFAIAEDGASVDTRAHVHDAVVLKGGVVESGASVVRALVCPGGVVRQKTTVVDQFVCPI